jgi:flagellar hook-basal body complex protein FliE
MNISQSQLSHVFGGSSSASTNRPSSGFMETLSEAMNQVENLQADADAHVAGLLQGTGEDVHSTVLAVEKADIAFQMMMQVRNKIVNAYQEISRMQF